MRDVVVIGAGPVGSYMASLLRGKMDVAVIERAPGVGHKACSGLVSTNLDRFVKVPKGLIEHRVKGAVMHSPGGSDIELRKEGTAAYVIDRPGFDRWMAGKADIMFSTEAKGVSVGKGGIDIRTGRGTLSSRVLIDCGGANSICARKFGAAPGELLTGLTAMAKEPDSSDHVEMWYNTEKLKDGFFWKIPRGDRTEYGMLGSKASFGQVERFFRIKGYEKAAAPIPMGMVKTYYDRVLLMGDAACQVKPWSGGGIIYGFTAAQAAAKALEKGDFSEAGLKAYEDAWKEKLAKPITFGLMFREFLKEMDNRELDAIFNKLRGAGLNGLDMDFPLLNNLPF